MLSANVIGLSPNLERDDFILSLKTLFLCSIWRRGKSTGLVEEWFAKTYHPYGLYSLNCGRSALFLLLSSLGLKKGDEVILQAFTCVAVPEIILFCAATPVYADIQKENFNLDTTDLQKKITSRTKAVIVQHTFGIPADIVRIKEICSKNNLFLIEDCAHSLGASFAGKLLGSYGDAAFFSFGRDKVVSSVFGGMLIINKKDKLLRKKSERLYHSFKFPSRFWIFKQLLHPIITYLVIHSYNFFNLGKILLYLVMKIKLLSPPVEKGELKGLRPAFLAQKFPNSLARLALHQLAKLSLFNAKRIKIAQFYGKIQEGGIYLRYPLLVSNPSRIISAAKKQKIILGNWYANVIDPKGTDMNIYRFYSCKNALYASQHIINLPTYPRLRVTDALKIKNIVQTA